MKKKELKNKTKTNKKQKWCKVCKHINRPNSLNRTAKRKEKEKRFVSADKGGRWGSGCS